MWTDFVLTIKLMDGVWDIYFLRISLFFGSVLEGLLRCFLGDAVGDMPLGFLGMLDWFLTHV